MSGDFDYDQAHDVLLAKALRIRRRNRLLAASIFFNTATCFSLALGSPRGVAVAFAIASFFTSVFLAM
jgi:hypothetical protein